MYKSFQFYTPYLSIFLEYPTLLSMVSSSSSKTSISQSQYDAIVAIGDAVSATKYPDRSKQRSFLDTKTVALVR